MAVPSGIVASLASVPATLTVGVAATISGTVTPLTASVPVYVAGKYLGTAKAIAGAWQLTAVPTADMVGSGVVVSVSGDTDTADVVQPYVDPDISNWNLTRVTPSGTTECTLTENTDDNTHLTRATLVNVDDSAPYTWTIQAKRGSGTRNLRINDGDGWVLIDLSDGSVTESGVGCEVTGPDGEGFYTIAAWSPASTGASVWCYFHNGSGVSYQGDGTSSIVLRGVSVAQDTEATGGWCDGETITVLAPADGMYCYRVAQRISVVAPSDPVVYVDGVSLGFAEWAGDGVYEVDWTPSQSDAVQISGDLSDTGEWTTANIDTVTGDNSTGYVLTENTATAQHRLTASDKIVNHDSSLPLTIIGRVKRSVGTRNLRVAYNGGFLTIDTSDGSQLAGTGGATLRSDVLGSGWVYFEATIPADAGTNAWLYMTDGTTTSYTGDGSSSLLVKDIAMVQAGVEIYAMTGDGTTSATHTVGVIDRTSPPAIAQVLLVIGQSNAVRFGGPAGDPPSSEASLQVILNDSLPTMTPKSDEVIGASSATTHGAGAAKQFVADIGADFGDYAGMIRTAYGGWSIVDDGDPSSASGDWQLYVEPFIATQLGTIETDSGLDARVVGVIYHQGEAEASAGGAALAAWQGEVETAFSRLQSAYPFARFTIGEIHDQGTDYQTLNGYAQDLADADDSVRCVGLNDVRIVWDNTDNVHVDTEGGYVGGQRLARTLGLSRR